MWFTKPLKIVHMNKTEEQYLKMEELAIVAWLDKKYRELQDLDLKGKEWVHHFKMFFSRWTKLPEAEKDATFRLRVKLEQIENHVRE